MDKKNKIPVITSDSASAWGQWLDKNHQATDGVWLRIFKKATNKVTITYAEALDEALCYGWIDGQKKKYDEKSWLQKFTPRRPRSIWSKKNRENVERLLKEKRMKAAGIEQVKLAKADGRWDNAYDSPSMMQIPKDFITALKKDNEAYAFFNTLNKSNIYAIAWRLQTAKKLTTRLRRMNKILDMMKNHEKFH